MDHEPTRVTLRAILNVAWGRVGYFVPVPEVVAASGLDAGQALAALDAAASRRWCYVRRAAVAASRWGLSFAMDWTHVARLLRVILNSSGGIGRAADYDVVVTACRLPKAEVHTLCQELHSLGLVCHGITPRPRPRRERTLQGGERLGPCVTASGWAYIANGCVSRPDDQQATAGGLLDSV